MAFRKAQRKQAKLRLGITGPAGGVKTYSSLLIVFGLGSRIAMVDTENGSGDLYAHLGNYDIYSLTAPYDVRKYFELIDEVGNPVAHQADKRNAFFTLPHNNDDEEQDRIHSGR